MNITALNSPAEKESEEEAMGRRIRWLRFEKLVGAGRSHRDTSQLTNTT